MEESVLPDFKDIETKLGRKVPESLIRSLTEEALHETKEGKPASPNVSVSLSNSSTLKRLESKMLFLKQEMAHLRAIDIKLMHQLLSINEGIESIKWVIEEKNTLASRESSLAGSMYSLSESQDTSLRGSYESLQEGSDGLDGISVGSYLDTLAEDVPGHTSPGDLEHFPDGTIIEDSMDKPSLHKDVKMDSDEYYCFG
ncbi:leucine rich adaptor protein 1-like [Lepisosteus oculatus]|nr:PREDICTED: leucine rich adaptor protein 1-like [Lepisosteus oculatus]